MIVGFGGLVGGGLGLGLGLGLGGSVGFGGNEGNGGYIVFGLMNGIIDLLGMFNNNGLLISGGLGGGVIVGIVGKFILFGIMLFFD